MPAFAHRGVSTERSLGDEVQCDRAGRRLVKVGPVAPRPHQDLGLVPTKNVLSEGQQEAGALLPPGVHARKWPPTRVAVPAAASANANLDGQWHATWASDRLSRSGHGGRIARCRVRLAKPGCGARGGRSSSAGQEEATDGYHDGRHAALPLPGRHHTGISRIMNSPTHVLSPPGPLGVGQHNRLAREHGRFDDPKWAVARCAIRGPGTEALTRTEGANAYPAEAGGTGPCSWLRTWLFPPGCRR